MSDSFYDTFANGYEAPEQPQASAKGKPMQFPHANRQNLLDDYEGRDSLQQKVDAAPTGKEKATNAKTEFYNMWINAPTRSNLTGIASQINAKYYRRRTGENYDELRDKYVIEFNEMKNY